MTASHEETAEFLWNAHTYTNEHIRFADTKAELVIGWTSAILGALLASDFERHFAATTVGALAFAGFAFLVAAFVAAFLAVIPRQPWKSEPGLIYWREILAHKDKAAYVAAIKAMPSDALPTHVGTHLYALARVCDKKFRFVTASIILAMIGSLLAGVMFLILH